MHTMNFLKSYWTNGINYIKAAFNLNNENSRQTTLWLNVQRIPRILVHLQSSIDFKSGNILNYTAIFLFHRHLCSIF